MDVICGLTYFCVLIVVLNYLFSLKVIQQ